MSTPDDMLREAERAKDANPCPETWQRLAEVRARMGWRSPEQIEREYLSKLMDENVHPNKEIAVLLGKYGGSIWSGSYLDGTVQEYRVNGKCRTWVTEPDRFNLPLKQGRNTFGGLTHYNMADFLCKRPTLPLQVTVRRVVLDRGGYVKENVLGISEGRYFGAGQKLWAVQVERPDADDSMFPDSPADSSWIHGLSPDLWVVRSQDRDSVRSEIRDHYRAKGYEVNFTK